MNVRRFLVGVLIFGVLFSATAQSSFGQQTRRYTQRSVVPQPVAKPTRAESEAEHDWRMKWFREARFGMFIHWGLYAVPAGEWKGKLIPGLGEWIMNHAQIPVAEYELLAKQFNP